MPFKSLSQRRLFYAKEKAGELPVGTAARWQAHTPAGAKLPDKVDDEPEAKKAFVRAFLLKCAAAGLTEPEQIAAAAVKAAEGGVLGFLGDTTKAVGGVAAGLAPWGPLLGHAAPLVAGAGLGVAAGTAKNQMDRDDTKVMRLAALANAYRRRTAEARTNAEVRKVVESDPSRYVVIG